MTRFSSPIHHQFGPLVDRQQCLRALGVLLLPWRYRCGRSTAIFAEQIGAAFGGDTFLFSSGREALLAVLRAIGLRPDEEVIVQGYTCIAVPNAVAAAGGRPIFVDIDAETLNLDIEEVRRAITPRTRAIICQHTFGIPADTERLRALCDAHRLALIEDCAHVLPDEGGPREVGRHGDFLLLSFGRDKAISGVSGGAIVSRREDVSRALKLLWMDAGHLERWTIARLLLYPLIYAVARPLYGAGIGKIFLKACQVLGLLIPIYLSEEKGGHMPKMIRRMPNACATLALAQWRKLRAINDHRRSLTQFYLQAFKDRGWKALEGITEDLPLQKFPMFIENADAIRIALKQRTIVLDDGWTGCVICPPSVDPTAADYQPGSDPRAEAASKQILNLPTHPGMTQQQAERLLQEIDAMLRGNSNSAAALRGRGILGRTI